MLALLSLALLVSACTATQLRSSSPSQGRRELFLCLLGLCDEEPNAADRDYSECEDRTDGIFGGRPLIGECGYFTELADILLEPEDTDGDGVTDRIIFNSNLAEGRVNADGTINGTVPASWLQIFPRDSLMWEIFGPEGTFDESVVDRAINAVFGENSTFGRIVVAPFALDWEPTFTNATCPTNAGGVTAVAPTPTCMTPLGSDGVYVCRTLYNPYTAVPDSKTICIRPSERLLASNDVCGCCGGICPEVVVEAECLCRCNLNGINDGLSIASDGLESCVSTERGVATIGQFDVVCSTACSQA